MRFEKMKTLGKTDLAFRPFLRWLDKNAEDLFTEALKEVGLFLTAFAKLTV